MIQLNVDDSLKCVGEGLDTQIFPSGVLSDVYKCRSSRKSKENREDMREESGSCKV